MTPSRRELLPLAAALAAAVRPADAQEAPAIGTVLPAGTHRVAANTTVKSDLLLYPGAVIEVAAGRTLTLLGGLIAPIATIFTGEGKVDLRGARIAHAHPEWWGAAPNDGARDSLPALRACLAAHPVTRLLAADYFISDTLIVERPFCRIEGAGFRGTGAGQGSRLVVTSGTADVLRAGPAARPRTVNDFPQNIEVHALALARSVAVDASGDTLPAGLRAQYLLFATFDQVSAFEHGAGFVARGLVRSTLRDCVAFRSIPGRQSDRPWRGFLLDGMEEIGLAGGNASIYLLQCNATIGGDPHVTDAVGLLAEGAFADTFVTGFETSGVATGIRVDGQTAAIGGRARVGHIDLHLAAPVIDQCKAVGIDIRDTSPQSLIDILDPYVATAPGAEAALRFYGMRGAASVTGGQLVAAPGGRAAGLLARASRGLQVSGLKITDLGRPAELRECAAFSLRLLIASPGARPGGSGIALRDCKGGTAEPLLSGQDGAFAAGVHVEGHGERLRLEATGIDPTAVGGPGNRVVVDGRAVPVPFRNAGLVIDGI